MNSVTHSLRSTTEGNSPFGSRLRVPWIVGAHAVLFALALLAAFLLAYNFRLFVKLTPDGEPLSCITEFYLPLLALALPIKLLVFWGARQYRMSWRYVGLRDLFAVTSTSLVSTFAFLIVYFLLENAWLQLFQHPLIDRLNKLRQSSVFALDWAATIVFVSAARVLVRFYYEDVHPVAAGEQVRALICGAGDAGETVLREILRLREERYQIVGFLDDDDAQRHGRIHDVEILARTSEIRRVCEEHNVEEVFIALPRATPKAIRTIVESCEGMGVRFRTIPAVTDVIEGRVQVSRMRDVDIADLLGREAVELDSDRIASELRGQCVLVTGAGGSIGSEMCRQIASYEPKRLILVERGENNLFEIDRELRRSFPMLDVTPYVADIVDEPRLQGIFQRERPAIVFHAAAHKHVPMMEINPGEAVKNNVVGTKSVAEASVAVGAKKMVLISTDKAINPTSVMGCTKRIAELCVQSMSGSGVTQFVTVRFGNVLGSSGSVVPIFKQQIAEGGPITVTHPEMTRYFMTITEAAQLVLQAGAMGRGGEIYILQMGEPVRIAELARDMITLSGLRPGIDIEIVFSGKRPGEKLHEELYHQSEDVADTGHRKVRIWRHKPADVQAIRQAVERLFRLADTASDAALAEELRRIVPEYRPDRAGLPTDDGSLPAESVELVRSANS